MTKAKSDLFSFRLFEDSEGIHALLSGSLARNFETLMKTCRTYCGCCGPRGDKTTETAES